MGGGLAATIASTPEYAPLVSRTAGIILISPLIGLPPENTPSAAKEFVSRYVCKLFPRYQIDHKMSPSIVTRDPAVAKSIEEDPFSFGMGTLEMFAGMLDRGEALRSGKLVLNDGVKSVYTVHGTGDKSTNYESTAKWFESQGTRAPHHKFTPLEGWSHCPYADLPDNRHIFTDDLSEWILERAKASA